MKKIFKIFSIVAFSAVALSSTGCDDFLEMNSSTDVNDNVAISNTANLDKVLIGTYKGLFMGGNVESSDRGLAGLTGMMSYYDCGGVDMTSLYGMGTSEHQCYTFADGRSQASGGYTKGVWTQYYDHINRCNIVLDALENATGTTAEKNIISGQAKAIRAISYFQLILNYQQTYAIAKDKRGVILRLHANDEDSMPFSTVAEVYAQIVKDLEDAKTELGEYAPGNLWRITTEVACAWLARVYQVKGDWANALTNANAAYKNHSALMTKDEWCSGFDDMITNNVKEVIWGYQNNNDTSVGESCPHGMWFNRDPSAGETNSSTIIYSFITYFTTQQWVDLFENDANDYRASRLETTPEDVAADPSRQVTDEQVQKVMLWHRCTNSDISNAHKWAYNKFKHYGVNGKCQPDIVLLRASEMLLIMAEAQANTGKETEALAYLNKLQNARNVTKITKTTSRNDLLEAIYVERRKELLGEGCTGMYDNVRLQKVATRIGESGANNYAGHYISNGLGYWGTKVADGLSSSMASNDYHYFLQIPEDEFSKNTAVDESEQNPFTGQ